MSQMGAAPRSTTVRYQVDVGSRSFQVDVVEGQDGLSVRLNGGEPVAAAVRSPRGDPLCSVHVGERAFPALVDGRDGLYTVVVGGETLEVNVQDERAARLARATEGGRQAVAETSVKAPMPGLVVAVHVGPGQAVSKGSSLVVLQAMKMENDLTAREDATIKEVLITPGDAVEQGQTLVTLE